MVLGRPIFRGGDTPDFEHAFSNRTHFRAYGRFWLSLVQRAPRIAGEKKKERIAVKPKSADKYVGRPNNNANVFKVRNVKITQEYEALADAR